MYDLEPLSDTNSTVNLKVVTQGKNVVIKNAMKTFLNLSFVSLKVRQFSPLFC